MDYGRTDIEKLCQAIGESVATISIATDLTEHEVFEVLEHIHVRQSGEISGAVQKLDTLEAVSRIGPAKLGVVIEEAIAIIAHNAQLDADKLAGVLTDKHGASVEDIVFWLHAQA
jgi:hypothetical protein